MMDKESAEHKKVTFECFGTTNDNHSMCHAFGSACYEEKSAKLNKKLENNVHWFAHCLLICKPSGETCPRACSEQKQTAALYILKNLQEQVVSG